MHAVTDSWLARSIFLLRVPGALRVLRALIALLASTSASACAQTEPPVPLSSLPIVLRASTPDGVGVSGLRAWADGRELGSTRGDGALKATVNGREGQRVVLTFACPPGHHTLDAQRELWLRRAQPLAAQPAALALTVRCDPIARVAALVVRARGPHSGGLPVRVQGELVGQTAADGTAHLLIATRAQHALRVTLDTSAVPAIRPVSPVQTYEMRDADRVLLFEQPFALEARAPIARQDPKRRPYRID
jgi:hypothetical protein